MVVARMHIVISVTNHADVPSGRILLGITAGWFDNYSIIGSAPAVASDRTDDAGLRTFSFPPVDAGVTSESVCTSSLYAIGGSTN